MPFPTSQKGNKTGDKARNPLPGIAVDNNDISRLLVYYHGNISRVADKIGCTRQTVARRIDNCPDLTKLKLECRERFIDSLEECSWHKALQGDTIMQLFLLKTIGKSRGYEQNDSQNAAQDVVKAAFEFVINRSKNPALPLTDSQQAIE